MVLDIELGQAPPLASLRALRLPICGCDGHFLASRHTTCYDCFRAARVWMHVAAELEEILSIAVCDGCDSDVAHSGSLVKWFSGSIVTRSAYESIVTTDRCVRRSIVFAFLVTVRTFFFFFSRVAHAVDGACDRALIPNDVYFFACFIFFAIGFAYFRLDDKLGCCILG